MNATVVPNNDDNAVTQTANTGAASVIFTSMAPIDIQFTVTASSGTTEYLIGNVVINNVTGTTWNDFHFQLGFGGCKLNVGCTPFTLSGNDSLDFDTPDKTPKPTSTAFTTLVHNDDTLDWSGGSVANGGTVGFTFSIDVPDGVAATGFTLRQFASVPEPGSVWLLGSGLILGAAILRGKGFVRLA